MASNGHAETAHWFPASAEFLHSLIERNSTYGISLPSRIIVTLDPTCVLNRVRAELLAYCHLDTLSMVRILAGCGEV